jgi:hypothetical protein
VESGGKLEMLSGSKISGNVNSSGSGGGVYVDGGTFTMNGGTISGNTSSSGGGGVYVGSGTFTKQLGGIIYGLDADSTLKNTAASGYGTGYAVYVSADKKRDGTVGESVTLDSTKSGAAGGWIEPIPGNLSLDESLEWLSVCAMEGGAYTIILNGNETIAPRPLSYSGKTVSIDLSGGTADRSVGLSSSGALFTVGSGVTLKLGNHVSLQGRSNNTSALVRVDSGGKLEMNSSSKISGNTNTSGSGGGVYVGRSGTFTMSGGIISGNSASSYGGGVYVGSGTFTMSGGTISGNTASSGGGVYIVGSSGTFTMSGGTISGNTASSGGGVYVSSYSGAFTKQSGGTIYGSGASDTLKNTATSNSYGHAVYVSSSKKRDSTAGPGITLDSTKTGAAGGWE